MSLEKIKRQAEKVAEKPLPILGTDGIAIAAMADKQKIKNNFIWRGEVYHALANGAITAYTECTVIGYQVDMKWIEVKVITRY